LFIIINNNKKMVEELEVIKGMVLAKKMVEELR
jgi:hypothetical protein